MSPKRPHGPQFLYDLGLENPSDSDHLSDAVPARTAPTLLPPIAPCSPVPVPVTALTTPLSYREHATPFAASATIGQPAITSFPNRDAIASLEFSCDPFGPSFDEPILLQGLHPTAGLELVADTARGHPRLRNCLSSTPAARIPLWRSRIRHAFLLAIDGLPVHSIDDVQQAFSKRLQPYGSQHAKLHFSCSRMMMSAPI
jgi:hypothetical protein